MSIILPFKNFDLSKNIFEICKKYKIEHYSINVDGSIDINHSEWLRGGVNLSDMNLSKIPLKFRNVHGNFFCYVNNLKSLEGCPDKVGGSFYCGSNLLTDLKHCPKYVGGEFDCSHNNLTSLEGSPNFIGSGYADFGNNNILDFGSKLISYSFSIFGNPIYDICRLDPDYFESGRLREGFMENMIEYGVIRGTKIIKKRLIQALEDCGLIESDYSKALDRISKYELI